MVSLASDIGFNHSASVAGKFDMEYLKWLNSVHQDQTAP